MGLGSRQTGAEDKQAFQRGVDGVVNLGQDLRTPKGRLHDSTGVGAGVHCLD